MAKWMSKVKEGIEQRGTAGSFSRSAKKAGMSTGAYAAKVTKPGSEASAKTKRRANLAKVFARARARR